MRWGEVGGGGGGDTEGGMGSAEGRGYLIVSDGQKGGRAWTIPEHSGWYGGVGGGGCQSASDEQQMDGGNRASSDLLFLFPTVRPPSDSLLLHTNHEMIFYAVPVCIYAVYLACIYPACNTHTHKKLNTTEGTMCILTNIIKQRHHY